jgi:mercuric ion transport protein
VKRSHERMVVGSAIGAMGVASAAVLGTLCCAGPAVSALLGAGGALTAAKLEPYRPYFLTLAFVLLGIGFWQAYAPRKSATEGAACKTRTGRKVRLILWLAAILTVTSALAPKLLS